jgi:hypothetical protein
MDPKHALVPAPVHMSRISESSEPAEREQPGTPPFRFGRRDHLINLGFWTLFGAVTAARLLADEYEPAGERRALVEAVYWICQSYLWATATPVIFWLVWRARARGGGAVRKYLPLVGAALAFTVLVGGIQSLAWEYVLGFPHHGEHTGATFWSANWFRFDDELITSASIFLVALVREYMGRVRADHERALRVQARGAEAEAHVAQLKAQLAHARLVMLRSQLNPHFLFNSLNAVSALIPNDTDGALRMVARLSELLRYGLAEESEEEIPLREELRLTKLYLEVLEIRFQGRLHTSVSADSGVEDALVPSLILQPLVENAMKHGVAKARGRGSIEVRAQRLDGSLVLTVRDTGGGSHAADPAELGAAPAGSGVGLANTRARLHELYGTDQRFTLRPGTDAGTEAEIVIPFRTASSPVRS